jgi:hypothetical protein
VVVNLGPGYGGLMNYNLDRGLLTKYQRGVTQDDVRSKFSQRCVCYLPATTLCTASGCGFDNFTYSGKNPACTVCNGTGKVTTWNTARVTVRVAWVDPARITFVRGVPTGEIGDVVLQAYNHDADLFETVQDTDGAYVLVDGKHVKPFAITVQRVESLTSIMVACNVVNETE